MRDCALSLPTCYGCRDFPSSFDYTNMLMQFRQRKIRPMLPEIQNRFSPIPEPFFLWNPFLLQWTYRFHREKPKPESGLHKIFLILSIVLFFRRAYWPLHIISPKETFR